MAKTARKKVAWKQVDTDTFPADLTKAFEEYKDSYTDEKDDWEKFKKMATEHLKTQKLVPAGKVPAFNYTGRVLLLTFVEPGKTTETGMFSFGNP